MLLRLNYKKIFCLVFLLSLLVSPVFSLENAGKAPAGWLTSLPEAQEKARKENKILLYYFTGSDWCGFCHQLEKEVLFTEDFKNWANDNAVLLYLDYPKLSKLPPELQQQNNNLLKQFPVEGFPTIVFLNNEGEFLNSMGYMQGGAGNWLNQAKMLLPKRLELEDNFAEAYFKAKRLQKPLIVLTTIGQYDPAANQLIADFLRQKRIVLNSGDNLLITRLDLTKATSDELGLWRNLSASSGVGKIYPAFIMVSPEYKLLAKAEGKQLSSISFAGAVYSAMPRPAYNGEWLTSYPLALRIARALNRPLLVNFTGSDWCKYCHILSDEVFSTTPFKDYASKKLVLVELDYPKNKTQPENIVQQNHLIRQAFNVTGFPLEIIMLNDNTPVGSFGYTGAKPAQVIDLIEKQIK